MPQNEVHATHQIPSSCNQSQEEIIELESQGGPYKVEVIADDSGKWAGNGMTFDTVEAALVYGADLFSRWTLVKEFRVQKVTPA